MGVPFRATEGSVPLPGTGGGGISILSPESSTPAFYRFGKFPRNPVSRVTDSFRHLPGRGR